MAAALFADENFNQEVVEKLRDLGYDVVTVAECGKRGSADPDVLAYATTLGRAVLTFNRRHFIRLHKQGIAHAGIIACTQDDPQELTSHIHAAIADANTLAGHLIRIYRKT